LKKLIALAKRLVAYARLLDIPVIHNAYTDVVLKVAGAFACLLQKFVVDSEGLKAVVDDEVCDYVRRFFEEYVARLGVEEYAETLSTAVKEEDAKKAVKKVLSDKLLTKAVLELYKGKLSKSALGARLGIRGHDRQQSLVNELRRLGLVEARQGVGVYLTHLGRAVAVKIRKISRRNDSIGSRDNPSPDGSSCVVQDYVIENTYMAPDSPEIVLNDTGLSLRTFELTPSSSNVSSGLTNRDSKRQFEQREVLRKVLEFVGRAGRPWRDLLEYVVKDLSVARPEPLLKHMLERGMLVKVKRGDEEWVLRG